VARGEARGAGAWRVALARGAGAWRVAIARRPLPVAVAAAAGGNSLPRREPAACLPAAKTSAGAHYLAPRAFGTALA